MRMGSTVYTIKMFYLFNFAKQRTQSKPGWSWLRFLLKTFVHHFHSGVFGLPATDVCQLPSWLNWFVIKRMSSLFNFGLQTFKCRCFTIKASPWFASPKELTCWLTVTPQSCDWSGGKWASEEDMNEIKGQTAVLDQMWQHFPVNACAARQLQSCTSLIDSSNTKKPCREQTT